MVAFPSLAQMIHDNDNEELSNYYVLVDEAAQVYAAKLTEQLGSSKYTGCADVTLDELIDAGYVQKFNDNKVTCSTGSGNIKIRNNKGVISVNFQLSCSEDGKDVYITGKNDNESCEAYVMETQTTLKTTLEGDSTIRKVNASNEVLVNQFLNGKITFDKIVEGIINEINNTFELYGDLPYTLENILEVDRLGSAK